LSPTDTGYHKGKYLPFANTLYKPNSFMAIAYNTKVFLIFPTPLGVGGRNIDLTLVKNPKLETKNHSRKRLRKNLQLDRNQSKRRQKPRSNPLSETYTKTSNLGSIYL